MKKNYWLTLTSSADTLWIQTARVILSAVNHCKSRTRFVENIVRNQINSIKLRTKSKKKMLQCTSSVTEYFNHSATNEQLCYSSVMQFMCISLSVLSVAFNYILRKDKIKKILYWAITRYNFQDAVLSTNLQTLTKIDCKSSMFKLKWRWWLFN